MQILEDGLIRLALPVEEMEPCADQQVVVFRLPLLLSQRSLARQRRVSAAAAVLSSKQPEDSLFVSATPSTAALSHELSQVRILTNIFACVLSACSTGAHAQTGFLRQAQGQVVTQGWIQSEARSERQIRTQACGYRTPWSATTTVLFYWAHLTSAQPR